MLLQIKGKPDFPLELGQLYLIGKKINGVKGKPENFIELEEEEELNERHCIVEISYNEKAYVFDLFTLKGTFLNNKPLNSLEKTSLTHGDILKLGKCEIKYIHEVNEVCHDSSGYLEGNKNISDIAFSPQVISEHNSKTDSFTIPETQYCNARNSPNVTEVSVAESIQDDNAGNIKFKPDKQNTFDDEDFCIPETQENNIFQKTAPILEAQNNSENSQFRICTQDYNEGFGEEESVGDLCSQVIPLVKHQTVILNNVTKCSAENLKNLSNAELEEVLSNVQRANVNQAHEVTDLRADCITPDLFIFDDLEAADEQQKVGKKVENMETIGEVSNFMCEDEVDLIPTQLFLPPVRNVNKVLNELEKPCVEKENEEVLTLSDKENRWPVILEPKLDLAPTQQLEAKSHTSTFRSTTNNFLKMCTTSKVENSKSSSSLDINDDEEDNILTQAFLQPPKLTISAKSTSSNNIPIVTITAPTSSDQIDKTPLKQTTSSATRSKLPDKEFTAATSENDFDLLMCTPQLIKDNIFVGRAADLKENILAAQNDNSVGEETDEEDDNVHSDLVKLIYVPKKFSDFDKLLPHLKRTPKGAKTSEKQNIAEDAEKMYKFNISGIDLDGKASSATVFKSSTFCRDERHAARDKQKEILDDKRQAKSKQKSRSRVKDRISTGYKVKPVEEHQDKTKQTEAGNNKRSNRREKAIKAEPITDPKKVEENINSKQEKNSRVLKRLFSSDEIRKEIESKTQNLSTKRMTRSKAKLIETPSTSKDLNKSEIAQRKEDNLDDVPTQPIIERKRKSELMPVAVSAKVERKRLRSTDSSAKLSPAVAISMSMVDQELFKKLLSGSNGLWSIAKSPTDCDVLVMDKACRTFKFLMSMARGVPIVTSDYLKKLNASKLAKEVRTDDYLFVDAEFEKKFKFSLTKSLKAAKGQKIFKDYEFLMTPNILPNPEEIKTLIKTSGGHVHDKTPPQPKKNQKIYLVTSKEDKKEWHKYRRLNKNVIIVSTEAIMSAVMRQDCDCMKSYTLT